MDIRITNGKDIALLPDTQMESILLFESLRAINRLRIPGAKWEDHEDGTVELVIMTLSGDVDADFRNRLSRGRSYVTHGCVIDLQISQAKFS